MIGVISGRFGDEATPIQTDADGRLIVRGQDQLFSIGGTILDYLAAFISGADGYIVYPAVPAGQYWVITNICARDTTTPLTEMIVMIQRGVNDIVLKHEVRAFVAYERMCWSGHTFLQDGDVVAAQFLGGLAGDTCSISISGYPITVEA